MRFSVLTYNLLHSAGAKRRVLMSLFDGHTERCGFVTTYDSKWSTVYSSRLLLFFGCFLSFFDCFLMTGLLCLGSSCRKRSLGSEDQLRPPGCFAGVQATPIGRWIVSLAATSWMSIFRSIFDDNNGPSLKRESSMVCFHGLFRCFLELFFSHNRKNMFQAICNPVAVLWTLSSVANLISQQANQTPLVFGFVPRHAQNPAFTQKSCPS